MSQTHRLKLHTECEKTNHMGYECPSNAQQLLPRGLKSLKPLFQVIPAILDLRWLLQILLRSLQAIGPGDLETLRQSRMEATVPIQSPQEFLIDRHPDHIREPLERD